jgi:glutaryl-CoA dehydrogenase (non-decarboxylating)
LPGQQTADPDQIAARTRSFAESELAPIAARADREGTLPDSAIAGLAGLGALNPPVRGRPGPAALSNLAFGRIAEEIGRVCSATRSFLTAHTMVQAALARWGTPDQRSRWQPPLRTGRLVGAFCLTEAGAGSDAAAVSMPAVRRPGGFVLDGEKLWVTMGQRADLLLVFASLEGRHCAFLVDGDAPGVVRRPVVQALGLRGAMLADITFDGCAVPERNLIGSVGSGISIVASHALDLGRFSVAWGCVGMGQACLDLSVRHAAQRVQFGVPLRDHQLVKGLLTDMYVDVEASRALAWRAAGSRDRAAADAVRATLAAKYLAARTAAAVASDALQLHGGAGCAAGHPVERYFRDARLMQIIEGSAQIHQILIADLLRPDRPAGGPA